MQQHQQGFTLIEILAVLVLLSVVLGMLTLSFSSNPAASLQREAARLQQLLALVSDEALIQSQEFAFATEADQADSYRLLRFDWQQQQWLNAEQQGFGLHQFDDSIRLSITHADQQLTEREQQGISLLQQQSLPESSAPIQLLFLSSGDHTPALITLRHQNIPEPLYLYSDGVSGFQLREAP